MKQQNYNVRFYSNPGTGKTSVARLYAALLQELGLLPAAAVEETSGAALVHGGVSGLKKVLEEKLKGGGVLFVDEAYQLNPKTNPLGAQVCIQWELRCKACNTWVGSMHLRALGGRVYWWFWLPAYCSLA